MNTIILNLNARLQPKHRHELEEAFEHVIKKLEPNIEITGGGTFYAKNGEIVSCDIVLNLTVISNNIINKIISLMEAMLAPIGSYLTILTEDNTTEIEKIPFGKQEGLALCLSNDLDLEVYENCDTNYVYNEIGNLLENAKKGHIASYWEGDQTCFYLYGESFKEMRQCIQSFIDSYPLCEKCSITKIA